eukprot:2386972-Heterocapsa_arctica.AAC.1
MAAISSGAAVSSSLLKMGMCGAAPGSCRLAAGAAMAWRSPGRPARASVMAAGAITIVPAGC